VYKGCANLEGIVPVVKKDSGYGYGYGDGYGYGYGDGTMIVYRDIFSWVYDELKEQDDEG
jgi:hypothetical protein